MKNSPQQFCLPQFIPNVAIFFVVLVTADNSRGTMEAIGVLIQSLDGLLERLQMSLEVSRKAIKKLSIFSTFRNDDEIRAIKIKILKLNFKYSQLWFSADFTFLFCIS